MSNILSRCLIVRLARARNWLTIPGPGVVDDTAREHLDTAAWLSGIPSDEELLAAYCGPSVLSPKLLCLTNGRIVMRRRWFLPEKLSLYYRDLKDSIIQTYSGRELRILTPGQSFSWRSPDVDDLCVGLRALKVMSAMYESVSQLEQGLTSEEADEGIWTIARICFAERPERREALLTVLSATLADECWPDVVSHAHRLYRNREEERPGLARLASVLRLCGGRAISEHFCSVHALQGEKRQRDGASQSVGIYAEYKIKIREAEIAGSSDFNDEETRTEHAIDFLARAPSWRRPTSRALIISDLAGFYLAKCSSDIHLLKRALALYCELLAEVTPERDLAEHVLVLHRRHRVYDAMDDLGTLAAAAWGTDAMLQSMQAIDGPDSSRVRAELLHLLALWYATLSKGSPHENLLAALAYVERGRDVLGEDDRYSDLYCRMLWTEASILLNFDWESRGKAVALCWAALERVTPLSDPSLYGGLHLLLADLLVQDLSPDNEYDLGKIEEYCRKARQVYTADADPSHYAMTYELLGTAYAVSASGGRNEHLALCTECFSEALSVITPESDPLRYTRVCIDLAKSLLLLGGDCRSGARQRAQDFLRGAVNLSRECGNPGQEIAASAMLAQLYLEDAEWSKAHRYYVSARELLAGSVDEAITLPGLFHEWRGADSILIGDAYVLSRMGCISEALGSLEALRARLIMSELGTRTESIRNVANGSSEVLNQLTTDEMTVRWDIPEPGYAATIAETRRQRTLSDEPSRPDAASATAWLRDTSDLAVRPAQLGVFLKRQEAIVHLVAHPTAVFAIITTHSQEDSGGTTLLVFDDLEYSELAGILGSRDGKVGYWQSVLSAPEDLPRCIEQVLALLGPKMVEPLVERLSCAGISKCYFVPFGVLSTLPIHACILAAGIHVDDRITVSYVPSAGFLAGARRREPASGLPSILAAAVPERQTREDSSQEIVMRPLPFARVEVEAISAVFPHDHARILVSEAATRDAVLSAAPGVTHIHVACHCTYKPGEPFSARMHLSGGDKLFVRDMLSSEQTLGVRLASLSACNSSLIGLDPLPNEALSMSTSFLASGVTGVLGALWPVNDVSASMFMRRFYENHIVGEMPPPVALRAAQQWLRSSSARELRLVEWFQDAATTPEADREIMLEAAEYYLEHPDDRPFEHPFFWAAYTYTGAE